MYDEKVFNSVIFTLFFFITAPLTYAVQRTYDGIGEYVMSDFETMEVAKQRAKLRAEQNAIEQAGVYIKSYTKSINAIVVQDEISVITAGILKITETKYSLQPLEGQAGSTLVRAIITALIDTKQVDDLINFTEEKAQYKRQIKNLLNNTKELEKENIFLKKQLTTVKTKQEEKRIKDEIKANDKKFLANEKIKEGIRLIKEQDYNSAMARFNEAIKISPNNYSVYFFRGENYAMLEKYPEAIADFNKAIASDPKMPLPYYGRAKIYSKLKQHTEVIADITKLFKLKYTPYILVKHKDILSEALSMRAEAYMHIDKYDLMQRDANVAIELDPNNLVAYYLRSFGYKRRKNYTQAISDMTKVIELAAESNATNLPLYYLLRANIYQEMGNRQKAQEDTDKSQIMIDNLKTKLK